MAKELAPDPAIGVWKLDVDKSNFALGPAPKNSVMKIQAWEDGLKVSVDTIDVHDSKLHAETAYKYNGQDYPLTGSLLTDSISARRINERKSETVWKKQGKVTLTAKTLISSDGETLTVMRTGMDGHGRIVDEVLVYERQ
jgi:hypothetical protein